MYATGKCYHKTTHSFLCWLGALFFFSSFNYSNGILLQTIIQGFRLFMKPYHCMDDDAKQGLFVSFCVKQEK